MTGQSVRAGRGVRGGRDGHLHLLHPPTSYGTLISSSLTLLPLRLTGAGVLSQLSWPLCFGSVSVSSRWSCRDAEFPTEAGRGGGGWGGWGGQTYVSFLPSPINQLYVNTRVTERTAATNDN